MTPDNISYVQRTPATAFFEHEENTCDNTPLEPSTVHHELLGGAGCAVIGGEE
jgi:hypothetical protein